MVRWTCLAVVLFAASCASPEAPSDWEVARVTPTDEIITPVDDEICTDIRTFAVASLADREDLTPLLDELARLGAVTGATGALGSLNDIRQLVDDETLTEVGRRVAIHDRFVAASGPIDDATSAACDVPLFTALYAISGFDECHVELEIPVAAYTQVPGDDGCVAEGRPDFLPCFVSEPVHLPVDCTSGEIVWAVGARWAPAGEPRDVRIDRFDPDAVIDEGPDIVTFVPGDECNRLHDLFIEEPLPNGLAPDFERLVRAVQPLPEELQELVVRFIEANLSPPSISEFEELVAELDLRTAQRCGLPLVSAWASIQAPAVTAPCWIATDVSYPAFRLHECPPEVDDVVTEPGIIGADLIEG